MSRLLAMLLMASGLFLYFASAATIGRCSRQAATARRGTELLRRPRLLPHAHDDASASAAPSTPRRLALWLFQLAASPRFISRLARGRLSGHFRAGEACASG